MDITFDFPVYHGECDKCEARFSCMTMRIHENFERTFSLYLPFYFALACFRLEPYREVTHMKMYPAIDGGMQLDINY